ncbi:glycerate kinase type-2 family protein [Fodinibius sp. Rm-B-1B1-1]|uniref:glycerate kinase type-2 family protein n=1 Tax=Fodinibius alkaliphilus TaxID=3140241 RepID=UPI00315B1E7C
MDFGNPHTLLKDLFLQGLEACSPQRALEVSVQFSEDSITVDGKKIACDGRPIYVWATGKAAVPMYQQVAELFGDRVTKSLVITGDAGQAKNCSADEVIVGSHPVPDESSVQAGKQTVSFFKQIPSNAIVLILISGGTSSLLAFPAHGITVRALSKLFGLLNNSGATIQEINTVRKHCSQIKGGQLLRYLNRTVTLIDLAISDVPGDDLSIIGSGPTVPDASTYQEAHDILLRYELWDQVSKSIREHISKGVAGKIDETVKLGKDPVTEHSSTIISSGRKLIQKIGDLAKQKGLSVKLFDEPFNADVETVVTIIADQIMRLEEGPMLFLFYGESTVQVTGGGKGGRNQELALRGAIEIEGHEKITWLSAGTDGIDGPTDAAGAVVDGTTIIKAREQDVDPETFLRDNDSYRFHQKMGTLLKTGPTGNNLMDVVMVFVDR